MSNNSNRNNEAQKVFGTGYLTEKEWANGKVDYYDVNGNYRGSSHTRLGGGYNYTGSNGQYHSSSHHYNGGK